MVVVLESLRLALTRRVDTRQPGDQDRDEQCTDDLLDYAERACLPQRGVRSPKPVLVSTVKLK